MSVSIQIHRAHRRDRLRLISAICFSATGLAGAAMLFANPKHPTVRVALPKQGQTEQPGIQTAPSVSAEAPVVHMPELVVVGNPAKPAVSLVALPSDDEKTDHRLEANQALDRGELKAALVSLRKHLFHHEAEVSTLLTIGRLGRQIGGHDVAERSLGEAVLIDPREPEVHVELSRLHLAKGDLKEAQAAARQAVRLDREGSSAWNLMGRVAMAQSQWEQSEMAFRKALQLDPTNAMIHNNLGLLYIYRKRGEDAVDSMEASVELYGDQAPHFVYNNLGLAHELLGNYEEAREAFEEAAILNPDYARARLNLRRVTKALEKERHREPEASNAIVFGDEAEASLRFDHHHE